MKKSFLLEKRTFSRPVQKLYAFYASKRFIAVFTKFFQETPLWTISYHSTSSTVSDINYNISLPSEVRITKRTHSVHGYQLLPNFHPNFSINYSKRDISSLQIFVYVSQNFIFGSAYFRYIFVFTECLSLDNTTKLLGHTHYLNIFISEFSSTYLLDAECFKYLCWKTRFKFHGYLTLILRHMFYTYVLMTRPFLLNAENNIVFTWNLGKTEIKEYSYISLWEVVRQTTALGKVLCWYQSQWSAGREKKELKVWARKKDEMKKNTKPNNEKPARKRKLVVSHTWRSCNK